MKEFFHDLELSVFVSLILIYFLDCHRFAGLWYGCLEWNSAQIGYLPKRQPQKNHFRPLCPHCRWNFAIERHFVRIYHQNKSKTEKKFTDKKLDTERHHYYFFRIITLYLQQGLKNMKYFFLRSLHGLKLKGGCIRFEVGHVSNNLLLSTGKRCFNILDLLNFFVMFKGGCTRFIYVQLQISCTLPFKYLLPN